MLKNQTDQSVSTITPLVTKTASSQALALAPNQFKLMVQRRFAPFFWTQFLSAFTDNVLKFALTILVTYQIQVDWLPPAMAGLVIGALFILPFILFSATSGQLSDKYSKSSIMRAVKTIEIGIMLLAGYGFITTNVAVLLGCIFLMGMHSTLFGPAKFAYLPQALEPRELTGGNGMVEMGTFVAILTGNIVGGLLIATDGFNRYGVSMVCLLLAILGRLVAHWIPALPATVPGLQINWNPVTETWRNLKMAAGIPVVFRSMLGISWMWFFGAVFLSLFPSFSKSTLQGDASVASLLLVVFSIGIAVGSVSCELFSRRQIEIGLVPIGAIGMSVFSIDLYFSTANLPRFPVMSAVTFLTMPIHWRLLADLALLSLFAGLYSVPMYALVQLRTEANYRARIMAANNILNALFMVTSALLVGWLLQTGATIPQIFLIAGLANLAVAAYLFLLVPEYVLRFLAFLASTFIYRFRINGDHYIPTHGPAILICNHVSYVDAILLMAASPRPIIFIMDHVVFQTPGLGAIFRLAKAIPITSRNDNSVLYTLAFERAAGTLKNGSLLAIFPEGKLTPNGELQEFKGGVMKIIEQAQRDGLNPPIIPMALLHLWGSLFSRARIASTVDGLSARAKRHGMFRKVDLNIGEPLPASEATVPMVRQRIEALLTMVD